MNSSESTVMDTISTCLPSGSTVMAASFSVSSAVFSGVRGNLYPNTCLKSLIKVSDSSLKSLTALAAGLSSYCSGISIEYIFSPSGFVKLFCRKFKSNKSGGEFLMQANR